MGIWPIKQSLKRKKTSLPSLHCSNHEVVKRMPSAHAKGQMSIFLAVVMVIIVGLMAFIINIGLFVKAKINLQNAVDAAAYSGAAVQARQLTNVAHMNWEMRNIYKEWMFKYYILGQLSLPNTQNPRPDGTMDFRLPPLISTLNIPAGSPIFNEAEYKQRDPWNIPSVCIDFAGTFKLCNTYSLPGLPLFQSLGLPGTDEIKQAFLQTILKEKSNDCSFRSRLNFLVANQWSYGLGTETPPPPGTPRIAIDRPGAFPQALESAIRIRNLERILNEPPKSNVNLGRVQELANKSATYQAPIHERTVKAFWAGYRNLNKSPDNEPNALKETFTLTELKPRPKIFAADFNKSLSTYLIPQQDLDEFKSGEKHYVDLQLQLVNYAIFFTLFVSRNVDNKATTQTGVDAVKEGASCGVRKTAIPVAGYPLGFVKNPNLLTYYAVKGESHFTGLMNPFSGSIKMVAYAAAKPFGGRIGPHLFQVQNGSKLIPRIPQSFNYITGLELSGESLSLKPNDAKFRGDPIPSQESFWLRGGGGNTLGGVPEGDETVTFGIPNMPFDFVEANDDGFGLSANLAFQSIPPRPSHGSGPVSENAGLHAAAQFFRFRPTHLLKRTSSLGHRELKVAMAHALRPTGYEAANYLIPSLEKHNQAQHIHSIGPIPSTSQDQATPENPYIYQLYAPLFGPGLLFQGPSDLTHIIENYFTRNTPAIQKYMKSLKQVAIVMRGVDVEDKKNIYQKAGATFHYAANDILFRNTSSASLQGTLSSIMADTTTHLDPTCESLAGKFTYLYLGTRRQNTDVSQCPRPLKESMIEHWQSILDDPLRSGTFRHFFTGRYVRPEDVNDQGLGIQRYMTGYLPGPRHGVEEGTGKIDTTFQLVGNENDMVHRRNHYSVKFIPLKSLNSSGNTSYEQTTFSLLGEGPGHLPSDGLGEVQFDNPLDSPGEVNDVEH